MQEPSQVPSTKSICEWIWKHEMKLQLLEQHDNGVYFWRLIRFPLWIALHEKTGIIAAPHPVPNRKKQILSLLGIPKAIVFHNPWIMRKKVKSIILPHARRINGVEIHSRPIIDQLDPKDSVLLYLDWRANQLPGAKNFTSSLLVGALRRKLLRQKIEPGKLLDHETQSMLTSIEDDMMATFGFRLDLHSMTAKYTDTFQRHRNMYKKLFKRLKAEELILVVGYTASHMAAIDAAQSCEMKTIEVQHGSFTKFIMGYSFPGYQKDVPYSPQLFLSLGDFWTNSVEMPRNTQVRLIGASHVYEQMNKLKSTTKEPNSILFISQGTVGIQLCQIAQECARLLPDYSITYRLHPSEHMDVYSQTFPANKMPPNFKLSQAGLSTNELLARSEIAAGVYSTALYEGMVLGCKTVLFNLPGGIEHMEETISCGDAIVVNSAKEFCANLKEAPLCKDPTMYYSPPKEIRLS